jgi:hypothetical protein
LKVKDRTWYERNASEIRRLTTDQQAATPGQRRQELNERPGRRSSPAQNRPVVAAAGAASHRKNSGESSGAHPGDQGREDPRPAVRHAE